MDAPAGRAGRRGLQLAGAILGGVVAYDMAQRRDAILRNFPIVGHFVWRPNRAG